MARMLCYCSLAPEEKESKSERERERAEVEKRETEFWPRGVLVGLDFTRGRDENLALRMNFSLSCQIGPTKIALLRAESFTARMAFSLK